MESKLILNSIGIGALFFAGMVVFWFVLVYFKKRAKGEQPKSGYATAAGSSGADQRRHERVDISWPALLEKSGESLKVQLKNISQGGAFVICSQPFALNDQFKITVNIPNHRPLQLNTEVVWSNVNMPRDKVVNRGMGVRFINNESETRQSLQEAIAAALEKTGDSIDEQP